MLLSIAPLVDQPCCASPAGPERALAISDSKRKSRLRGGTRVGPGEPGYREWLVGIGLAERLPRKII